VKQLENLRRETAAQRETTDAVEDLQRLRNILMEHAEITLREAKGLLTTDEYENCVRGVDPGQKAIRLARSVRHTVVLTQELLGLRPVPGTRAAAAAETQSAADTEHREPREHPERERREDFREREVFDHAGRPTAEIIEELRDEVDALTKPRPRSKGAPPQRYEPIGHWLAPAGAPGVKPVEYPNERGPP
jgi:hypothetical protein